MSLKIAEIQTARGNVRQQMALSVSCSYLRGSSRAQLHILLAAHSQYFHSDILFLAMRYSTANKQEANWTQKSDLTELDVYRK